MIRRDRFGRRVWIGPIHFVLLALVLGAIALFAVVAVVAR